jgi:hypothetical protein
MKQCTRNPSAESLVKGWELFSYFTVCFPPRPILKNFIMTFFERNRDGHVDGEFDFSKNSPKIRHMALRCAESLPKIVLQGMRNQIPSTEELIWLKGRADAELLLESTERENTEATETKQESKEEAETSSTGPGLAMFSLQVYLINNAQQTLNVDSFTLVREVEAELVRACGLNLKEPFRLFQCILPDQKTNVGKNSWINVDNKDQVLDPRERVMDYLGGWEDDPLEELDLKERQTFQRKKKQVIQKTEVKFNALLFKAKLVLKAQSLRVFGSIDEAAVRLVYHQAKHELVTERYPCGVRLRTELFDRLVRCAARQLQAEQDYSPSQTYAALYERLKLLLPRSFLETEKAWKSKVGSSESKRLVTRIIEEWKTLEGHTHVECQMGFLDIVGEWTHYGATFFSVKAQKNSFQHFSGNPTNVLFGVNCDGITFLNSKSLSLDQNTHHPFSKVVQWGSTDTRFVIVTGNPIQQQKRILGTHDGPRICELINSYIQFKLTQN